MKKNHTINNDVNIVKKLVLFTELLVLFLVISSSIAMAYTGFSGENKPISVSTDHKFIHKYITNQTKSSTKVGLAPENPKFTEYKNRKLVYKATQSPNIHKAGFSPSPVDLSHLKHAPLAGVYASANTSIPISYDLRTLNRITPVKNQGSAGSCWTFATDASLESYLMPGETWSFSENSLKNVLSSANSPQGFDRGPSDGGDFVMSTAYETRWSGPVNTSDDPYSASSSFSSSEIGFPVPKHVQNVNFLPNRNGPTDNQDIKKAIMNYGAVCTALYFSPSDTNSYNQNTYSYYYSGTEASDHAVTIVGWNDDYSASNFSTTPPGNGAFIIKNSWGTTAADWGNVKNDNGYFYISYYDSNVGYNMNTFFTAENSKDYTNIYQYDPLGWTQQINTSQTNPTTGWGANIFTANSNEYLNAVSFYTTDLNCNYVINIYKNTGSNPVSQTGPALTQSGTISSAGYHTVPLNSGIQLNAGQKFSVVLELTNPTYQYPIPVEMPISGYSSQATANVSESFVSSDGNTWTDITTEPSYSNTNVCIKAFTGPESRSEKGLPMANFNTNVTNGNVPLTVQFTDISTDATGWGWDFGDGVISTELNPMHTYIAAGVYNVNETVSNTNGTNSMLATINVLKKGLPTANFNTNVTNGNVPLTVQFTDISTDATGWGWDFGDGVISTELNPMHTYIAAGVYTVNETVSNTNYTNSMLATINVLKTTPQNTPTITWSNPADILYGTPLSYIQLSASASDSVSGETVLGTFVYTPPSGTILRPGTQTLSVSFTPDDTANYNTASKAVTIRVRHHRRHYWGS
jgi:C1A family cysteine protease